VVGAPGVRPCIPPVRPGWIIMEQLNEARLALDGSGTTWDPISDREITTSMLPVYDQLRECEALQAAFPCEATGKVITTLIGTLQRLQRMGDDEDRHEGESYDLVEGFPEGGVEETRALLDAERAAAGEPVDPED